MAPGAADWGAVSNLSSPWRTLSAWIRVAGNLIWERLSVSLVITYALPGRLKTPDNVRFIRTGGSSNYEERRWAAAIGQLRYSVPFLFFIYFSLLFIYLFIILLGFFGWWLESVAIE